MHQQKSDTEKRSDMRRFLGTGEKFQKIITHRDFLYRYNIFVQDISLILNLY